MLGFLSLGVKKAGKVPNAKTGSFVVSAFNEEKVQPVNGFYVSS